MKIDRHLEKRLIAMASKFDNLEQELRDMQEIWDKLVICYSGHPLENLAELVHDYRED